MLGTYVEGRQLIFCQHVLCLYLLGSLKMNLNDHPATISRATSRASHRSRNSSLSRAQSLVKKNIELIDLKPADVLIERFVAWKVIVKQLTSYFEVSAQGFTSERINIFVGNR